MTPVTAASRLRSTTHEDRKQSIKNSHGFVALQWRYSREQQGYRVGTTDQWTYEETVRGEVRTDQRRIYVHVYYNEERAAAEKRRFNQTRAALETALRDGAASEEQLKAGMKYFTVSETPKRG